MKRIVKYLNNFKHFDKVSDSGNGRLTSHVCRNYKIHLNRSKKLITPRNREGVIIQTLIYDQSDQTISNIRLDILKSTLPHEIFLHYFSFAKLFSLLQMLDNVLMKTTVSK